MNKQRRGDAPLGAEKPNMSPSDPLHDTVAQGGFGTDNIGSGNLRQHNGCHYTGPADGAVNKGKKDY